MSLVNKISLLIGKINNNIGAVKQRHTYSGNKVDVSQDILNIRSVPVGQVVSGIRRPTSLTTDGGWVIPSENTILKTGDGVVKYVTNEFTLPVYVNGEEIGRLPSVSYALPQTITYCINSPVATSIQIGATHLSMTVSGFSYADFVPKNNAIMEILINVKFSAGSAEFNSIYVRYINP